MISNEMYDRLRLVAIAITFVGGFVSGAGELMKDGRITLAGAIITLAGGTLQQFLKESSKQYWASIEASKNSSSAGV